MPAALACKKKICKMDDCTFRVLNFRVSLTIHEINENKTPRENKRH